MAVGFAAAAFVGISDALPGEVRTSLLSVAANSHPGWFVIIDVPPNGVARGIQIGLLCVGARGRAGSDPGSRPREATCPP
jgi:hypothetical protein